MNHTFPFILLLSAFSYKLMGQEDTLEKGMATHSNILTGKSHRLRSLVDYSPQGHKRIGHDFVTKQQQG